MTKYLLAPFLLSQLLFMSCKSHQLAVNTELRTNGQEIAVKGRQNLRFKQQLTFGEFSTSYIRRGWTSSYDLPFVVRFQGAQEKFSFTQFDGKGNRAEVYAVAKVKSVEMPNLLQHFGFEIPLQNVFAGTIYMPQTKKSYDFVLYNPDSNLERLPTKGQLNSEETAISIKGVTEMQDRKLWNTDNLGFEFSIGNQAVGATQTFNKGMVWLRNDLPDETRLLLSALSTALMVRNQYLSRR